MRRGRTILSEKQTGTDEEAELLVRVRLSLGVKGGGLLRLFFRGFSLRHSSTLTEETGKYYLGRSIQHENRNRL